jgi:hypothetical protein
VHAGLNHARGKRYGRSRIELCQIWANVIVTWSGTQFSASTRKVRSSVLRRWICRRTARRPHPRTAPRHQDQAITLLVEFEAG